MPDFQQLRILESDDFISREKWEGLITKLYEFTSQIHLTRDNRVGIGTGAHDPKGALHILYESSPLEGSDLHATEKGLVIGSAGTDSYKWIQSYGGPLCINPKGNNVGIGTTS